MTRPSLAGIDPLSATPWTSRVTGTSNGVRVYDGKGHPLPGCFSCGENDAVYEPEDGALIAAAPDLLAAVRDVLALHQPCDNDIARTPICQTCRGRAGVWECGCWADEDRQPVCSSCTYSDPLGRVTPSAYPCATVRALAARLDLTDPEGDPT